MAMYNGKKVLSAYYNNKKIFCSVMRRLLPAAYQEVEYIDSDISGGVPFIDTGLSTFCDFEIISCPKTGQVNVTAGNASAFLERESSANPYWHLVISERSYNTTVSVYQKTKNALRNGVYSINDNIIATVSGDYYVGTYLYLFRNNATLSYTYPQKIYSVKTWDKQGNLTRFFIPCYRKADGEIGFYDLVNDIFYRNAGTGTFIKGGNV